MNLTICIGAEGDFSCVVLVVLVLHMRRLVQAFAVLGVAFAADFFHFYLHCVSPPICFALVLTPIA